MDSITLVIAPLGTRIRAAVLFAVSLVLAAYAMFYAPWFRATLDGHSYAIQMMFVRDEPGLIAHDSLAKIVVLFSLFLAALAYLKRLAFLGVALVRGQPHVKRGLFRAKLMVAWKSPVRAHVHTAILLGLAIAAAVIAPALGERGSHENLRGVEIAYSWGGALLVAAFVLAHVAIHVVARNPLLASTQVWDTGVEADAPVTAKPRAERPMIKSPLPSPPAGADAASPFRAAGAVGPSLEAKLVRPVMPTSAPAVVRRADSNADEPSLLR